MTRETVWYIAPYNSIVITHKENGVFWSTPEEYDFEFRGIIYNIPNRLCLIRNKINLKNWKMGERKGWIIKLGVL